MGGREWEGESGRESERERVRGREWEERVGGREWEIEREGMKERYRCRQLMRWRTKKI